MASELELFGPILVTGGCGFQGYHIIRFLLQDSQCGQITAVSRNPNVNIQDKVIYRAGDIISSDFVKALIQEVKPQVIIHTASPRYSVKSHEFHDTNVKGTINLLEHATKAPFVKAFIYSSSVNVLAGSPHIRADEDRPMWQPNSAAIPYWKSKAEAERLVLKANSPNLRTVSLRLCLIIGERDHQMIPAMLDSYNMKKTGVQIGENKSLFDTVSAENAAIAHCLAMKALLAPQNVTGKVDGEAFNITDDNGLPFWDIARMVWRAAGDTTELKDVKVIPGWIAMIMAHFLELVFTIFTFGTKKPELNTHFVDACTNEYTYNIDKARMILGYNPVPKTEEVLKHAVEWELQRRAANEKKST